MRSLTRDQTSSPRQGPSHQASLVKTYVFFSNDMTWAATTVWCYDYLLTLDKEARYFWYSKWSLNKVLFLGYRYPVLLNTVLNYWVRFMVQTSFCACGIVLHGQMAMVIIDVVSATVFAALRVYALFDRNRVLFTLVLISGLLNPAIMIYIFTRSIPAPLILFQGCSLSIVGRSMAARAASVLSDSIVLILTMMKTYMKAHDTAEHPAPGALFLCIINTIGIGTARMTVTIQIVQTWISILTSILLSRLALDLRETALLEFAGTTELDASVGSNLVFAGVDDPVRHATDEPLEDLDSNQRSVSDGYHADLEC
ncbi:uncharacterized protein B0H18DRAFT_1017678 [Fomitopsis serialis]|uniref:uncharacterized protein n=1 Tax=Fomitopsis serialis TaxID=139415 RepID=UPI002007F963|nr:uncharacterized protein B0H18DRAFT_1017678 [Neoantrodia serialis]KAH9922474.1 hypothetical protein B0H18DRAFT_1017678 [Neoantrodia serialis]